MLLTMRCMLVLLLVSVIVNADPVVHKFQIWGVATTKVEKGLLYWGWSNGFLQSRGPGAIELMTCLEGMSGEQTIAMIDKYYTGHPEKCSQAFGEEMLEAVTVQGGPCEGKNVWK
jgi:hypothetical protein